VVRGEDAQAAVRCPSLRCPEDWGNGLLLRKSLYTRSIPVAALSDLTAVHFFTAPHYGVIGRARTFERSSKAARLEPYATSRGGR